MHLFRETFSVAAIFQGNFFFLLNTFCKFWYAAEKWVMRAEE